MKHFIVSIDTSEKELEDIFKEWFSSYGEFKFLDYIDSTNPKSDYGGIVIKIKRNEK